MVSLSKAPGGMILKKAKLGDNATFRLPLREMAVAAQALQPDFEALRRELQAEVDELKRQAEEEGRRQGFSEGLEQARSEAGEIRSRAQAVLREAEEIRRQILDELEAEIRSLAVEIAEKLVARHLVLDPETIAEVAREALEMVRDRESVVIYAHPSYVGHLQGAASRLKELLPEGAVLRIVGDAGLAVGGCLVETEQGLVDATTDVRWQEILKALG